MDFRTVLNLSKFGLLAGILAISLHFSLYFAEKSLLTRFTVNISILLTIVGVMIMGAIMFRSSQGGFIDFRSAFLCGVVIFAAASFLYLSYTYILYVVDPDFYNLLKEQGVRNTRYWLGKMNTPDRQIEESMREITTKRHNIFQHLLTFFKLNVAGMGFAALIAIFVKRAPVTV